MTDEENKEEDADNDSDDSFSLHASKGKKKTVKKAPPQSKKKQRALPVKKSSKSKLIKKRISSASAPVNESPNIISIKKVIVKPKAVVAGKEMRIVNPFSRKRVTKELKEKYECGKCGEVFHSGWALGGHASRVHPGESDSYRRKIQRREERTLERKLLELAKLKHDEMFGENAPINRVKIRKFKKEFKKQLLSGQQPMDHSYDVEESSELL